MGFFSDMFGTVSKESELLKRRKSLRQRICRIEEMEPRELLSATPYSAPDPINVGIVYHEDYYQGLQNNTGDADGDTFAAAWNGGVDGTTLDQIVIDLNKDSAFPHSANILFNETGKFVNSDGTYFPFTYAGLEQNKGNGITVTSYHVSEDGKTLTINFNGFTSGKKFYFKIDVDEINGEYAPTTDRLVSGAEMEGAVVTGKFSVDQYEDKMFSFKMVNDYSDESAQKAAVPLDDYQSEIGKDDHDNTAGAVGSLDPQTPLKGSLSGYVYEDTNNNGIKETGEIGISGVQLELLYYNTKTGYYESTHRFVTTDENGYYIFDNIAGNTVYTVVESQPDDYLDGKDSIGKINGVQDTQAVHYEPDTIADIHLGAGAVGIEYNFGEYRLGSISGNVYEDDDNDGTRDPNEKGIEGVTIYLCEVDEDGNQHNIAQTLTDANGNYSFEHILEPGKKYCLTEIDPEGYCDGKNAIGTVNGVTVGEFKPDPDGMTNIVVGSGQEGINYNFAENRKGSISGYVYLDSNKNGVKDSGETGIKDVLLTLWVWNETEQQYIQTNKTATTNSSGYYQFEGLCPFKRYQIAETQPGNYDDGAETIGSLGGSLPANDVISRIDLPPGGTGVNYNFGEHEPGTAPVPGSLSGYVYLDANKNGQRDSGEHGIGSVKITLEKLVNGSYIYVTETTTDSAGHYVFSNLDPNEQYRIVETQPVNYDDGAETVGTLGGDKSENDVIKNILVEDNQHGTNYNFGELEPDTPPPPPPPEPGSLSGYVYIDANQNGKRDAAEHGIGFVAVTLEKLENGSYVYVAEATTDSGGYYSFLDLEPGTYRIVETQPTAYDDGAEAVGSLGGELSANDVISNIVLQAEEFGVDYNFGELEPVVPPPPPLPPSLPPPPPSNPPSPPSTPALSRPSGALGIAGSAGTPYWQTPATGEQLRTGYGSGGALQTGYSWHLSVINAGYPRQNGATDSAQGIVASRYASSQTMILDPKTDAGLSDQARYVSVAWTPLPMNQSVWYVRDKNGNVKKRFKFGPEGGRPMVGDFNGDGIAELAVFHNGNWYIDVNGNGEWDPEDLWCELGTASDQPVVGDWDGDGKTDIGVFGPQWSGDAAIAAEEPGLPSDLNPTVSARPKNAPPSVSINRAASNVRAMKHSETGGVRLDVIDHVFQYGGEGDKAFTGDFSGDGVTKIGIYRNGKWYIDRNGNGQWDDEDIYIDNADYGLGTNGIPVVGDFNGDGIDNIGLFVDGVWHLDTAGNFKFDTKIEFGQAGDYPVVGDFDGDGITQLAVYRASAEDSLQAKMPAAAPAETAGVYAKQFTGEDSAQGTENKTDQGTLPQKLQHHGRSMHTPHSNAPLHRQH